MHAILFKYRMAANSPTINSVAEIKRNKSHFRIIHSINIPTNTAASHNYCRITAKPIKITYVFRQYFSVWSCRIQFCTPMSECSAWKSIHWNYGQYLKLVLNFMTMMQLHCNSDAVELVRETKRHTICIVMVPMSAFVAQAWPVQFNWSAVWHLHYYTTLALSLHSPSLLCICHWYCRKSL